MVLEKALDTVDHSILLRCFYGIWFGGWLSELLSFWLHNLFHWVILNLMMNILSVTRGSVLGLILFILFINDRLNVANQFRYVLFADDTNILYSRKYFKNNRELNNICQWLCTNKLPINLSNQFHVF